MLTIDGVQYNNVRELSAEQVSLVRRHFKIEINKALNEKGVDDHSKGQKLVVLSNALTRFEMYAEAKKCMSLAIPLRRETRPSGLLHHKIAALPSPKTVFVHLPKTGGTSFEDAVSQVGCSVGHKALCDDIEEVKDNTYYQLQHEMYFNVTSHADVKIVTTVRNIYSFMVSWYLDVMRFKFAPNFIEDFAAAQKGFEYYIKFLSERESCWISRDLIFFQPFLQPSGKLRANWINRLETINEDWSAYCKSVGIETQNPDDTAVPHLNHKGKDDFKSFYTDELVELVQATWRDDIELYGFDFDKPYKEGTFLHRNVESHWDDLSYSFHSGGGLKRTGA